MKTIPGYAANNGSVKRWNEKEWKSCPKQKAFRNRENRRVRKDSHNFSYTKEMEQVNAN